MSIPLRIILLAGAVATFLFIFSKIRSNKMLISHTVFWSLFAIGLVVLGVFPGIAIWAAGLLGFESTANFVFLVMIFLLIVKLFTSTVKIAKLDHKMTELSEHIALREAAEQKNASPAQEREALNE